MKKRLLSILLAAAMLLSVLPTAFATETDEFVPVAVELVNPDFESNPAETVVPGWEASGFGAWAVGTVCTTYSNNWHITNQSLVVMQGAWASQKVENLVPGATYRLTANMCGWDDGGAGVLALEMLDASGAVIATESVDAVYGGAGAINENVVEATLPANCTAVNIKVSNGAEASMWCLADDFTLTQIAEPKPFEPVAVELVNPGFEDNPSELVVPGWEASGFGAWSPGTVCTTYSNNWHITNQSLVVMQGAWASQKVENLVPGATYRLTANMCGWDEGGAGVLALEMLDASGAVIATESVDAVYGGAGAINENVVEATLPGNCTAVNIKVSNGAEASMWCLADDFTLTQMTAGNPYAPIVPSDPTVEEFQPIPVELENGSFETLTANGSQAKGWAPGDGGSNTYVTYVTGVATDGNVSCKMANESNRTAYHVYNDYWVKGLIPGGTYKITYDVKGSLTWLGDAEAEPANNMGMDILPYDYTGTWVEGASIMSIGGIKVTDEWQTHEGEITLPQGCTRIVLRPGFYNWGGAIYLDNFTVTLMEVPEGVDPSAPTEPAEDDEPRFDPADSVDGVQMIFNPSFEIVDTASGKPSGHDYLIQAGNEDTSIGINTDPTYVRTGTNSVHLLNDGPGALVAVLPDHIPLTKGATYVLSYWVKGEATAQVFPYTGLVFGTDADGSLETPGVESESTKISADPTRWQNVIVTFVAPSNRDYVHPYIGFAWGTGNLYIDDIEMYLVAMPGGESIDGLQWLDNGNFEEVTDGVTDGHTFTGDVSVETTEVYEGTNSLKMTGSEDAYVTIPVRNAVSGGTYTVSFWHKGELDEGSITLTADLYRENDVSDATDNFRGTLNAGAAVPGSEWQQFVGVLSIPTNAKYAEVKIGFTEGSGTVYVDDAQMLLVTGPDLARLLPDQVFYYTGENETGKAITTFYEGYHAADMVEIDFELIDNADGTVLASADNVAIVNDQAVFEFDMDLLTKEQYGYTVRATIYNKGFDNPRMILSDKVYVWDRPLALNANGEFLDGDFDENGNYVPNGEIFTPVIGFEVYGSRGLESGNLQAEHLEKLKEGGINTILYYIPSNDDQNGWKKTIEELDLVHSLGMKALILMYWGMAPAGAPSNLSRQPATVEALKDHPAIYAWYTADEPFSHDADGDRVRQQLIDGYKMIREIDPVHPIYYTEDNAPRYAESDHYADIVSIDPYSGAAADYEVRVGDRTAQVTSETDNARPVNNILQAFTFAGSKPTEAQFQNMLYAAYLGGSRTLGYWCVQDWDPDPVIYERDLWNVITSFNANEYPIIVEQYADGQGVFEAQSRGSSAWYDLWEADGAYYLMVTNRTRSTNVVNVPFAGDIAALELVTQYLTAGIELAETADGFSVTLPASQGALVKITGELAEAPEPDTTELEEAIDAVDELVVDDYTADSWAAVEEALEAAEAVLADPDATQDEIDAAVAALEAAIEALETKPEAPKPPVRPVLPILPVRPSAPVVKFPFVDVPATAWYYDEVKLAWEKDLIDGMTGTLFAPDKSLTVAQAIKLAAALHQLDYAGRVTLKNGAVNWYDTYVAYAVDKGVIDAKYESYTYAQMNAEISRAEFVAIFHGAMDSYKAINTVADNAIPDVKMDHEYAAEIYEFYRAGILGGNDSKGTFLPEDTINRAEMTAILIRMFDASVRKTFTLL